MNEKYMNLIRACLPDALVKAISDKTGIEKKSVENCSLEIVARVFGDGNDLTKAGILERLKNVVGNEELKSIIVRSENRYGIKAADTSNIIQELLPILFQRISTLEDTYFDIKHPVQVEELEEVKDNEPSMDEIYKNIEKKAEAQIHPQTKIPKVVKKNKSLLSRRHKAIKPVDTNEVNVNTDNNEIGLIEKICMAVVLVALLALIGTVVFLFVKQKIA